MQTRIWVKITTITTVLLTIAGDQVPDIPFEEVGPKIGEGEPKQIGAIGLKLGVVVKVHKAHYKLSQSDHKDM
jgi:hypothetical protein